MRSNVRKGLALFFLVCQFAAGIPAFAQTPTPNIQSIYIGPGPLIVGMKKTDLILHQSSGKFSTERQFDEVIARTIWELLPSYIARSLERSLDRPVIVVSEFDELQFMARDGKPLAAIIQSEVVSTAGFGVRVATKVSVRPKSTVIEGEENLLVSPSTNFGELERKLLDHGVRTSKKFAMLSSGESQAFAQVGPRGIVQFFCITPDNLEDRKLAQLSQRLTLELPFHLTEASKKRGVEVFVRGLGIRESFACVNPSGLSGIQPTGGTQGTVENYTWDGSLAMERRNSATKDPTKALLSIRVSDAVAGGNFRRIAPVPIDDPSSPQLADIADKILDGIVKAYASK
jgi:hypothetical protein